MKFECPSCFMFWEDSTKPLEQLCHPLCVFCSLRHTQKELLNWQMDHIEDIHSKHFPKVLRHFYRYVEQKINLLEESYEQRKKKENIDQS